MQYKAYIRDVFYEWYEGSLYLDVNGISFAAAYTVNCDEFIARHLKIGAQITVDLWLRYCNHIKYLPVDAPKSFPQNRKICGGSIQGMVVSSHEPVEMSRNVQSGNTQNLKSSAAPVRLPAAPAPTPGTSQAAAPAGCAYRP